MRMMMVLQGEGLVSEREDECKRAMMARRSTDLVRIRKSGMKIMRAYREEEGNSMEGKKNVAVQVT